MRYAGYIRKLIALTVTLGMGSVVLGGCGSTKAASSGTASKTSSSQPASGGSQQLVLYQAAGYAPAVAAAFQKKTGIAVKVVHLATGPLASKIQAEGNYPQWDVAWFDDSTTMQALDNLGLLQTGWTPSDVSNYSAMGTSLLPKDKAYFPMGYTAAAAIAYNPKVLSPSQAPTTWSDLLKPEFKNAVAMNNPAISGPTYPFVAGIIQEKGLAGGEQFFTQLKQNGLQVYAKNGPTIQALLTGKVKVALAQDAALIGKEVKGSSIAIVYPKSGTFLLKNIMSIAKHAKDPKAAEKFVEFCLTPQAQKIMNDPKQGGSDSYRTPLISGVSPDPQVKTAGVKWIPLNTVAAAKNRTTVLQWFTQNIVH